MLGHLVQAQTPIRLENPSFEDRPAVGKVPWGWANARSEQASPPDVQPGGGYECFEVAQHGRTYVGLVTRADGSSEAIEQILPEGQRLERGKRYQWRIWLAHSLGYLMPTKLLQKPFRYSAAAQLRIWGKNRLTGQEELLSETPAVGHNDWKCYALTLCPQRLDCDMLVLEAFQPEAAASNGNLLIDHCSDILLH